MYKEGRDNRGHEADANLGITKLCFSAGDGEVTDGCDSRAASDGRTIYGGDCDFRKVIDRAEEPRHGAGVLKILLMSTAGQSFEVLKIKSSGECFACARDDQHL